MSTSLQRYRLRCVRLERFTDPILQSFELLKSALLTQPTLRHPNFDLPFYVKPDWSKLGMGALLTQIDHDTDHEYVVAPL